MQRTLENVSHGPLSGFTIGVTADRSADEQIELLVGRGADCLHGPVIRTHPIGSEEALADATRELIDAPPDVVVVTTGLGVRSWLEAADAIQHGDGLCEVLGGAELFARGRSARGTLVAAGLGVVNEDPFARCSLVVDALAARRIEGARVAVQLDGAGTTDLCDSIESLGAEVVRVPGPRWSLPEDTTTSERLVRATVDGRLDAVTFTERPAVENFFEMLHGVGYSDQTRSRGSRD